MRAFMSRSAVFGILGLAIGPLLSACGGDATVGQALGVDQRGPDELAVISRPPLILPPDYNLRPPRSGEQAADGRAASDAAREALVGRPSAAEDGAAADGSASTRALLTNGAAAGDSSEAASEGQNFLVSRTDRTERELDELVETRGENRVDNALLRRLLAWTPDDRPAPAADENAEQAETGAVVRVVKRTQSVIGAAPEPAPTSAE